MVIAFGKMNNFNLRKKSKLTKIRNIVFGFDAKWGHPHSSSGYDFSISFSSNLNHS